MRALHVGCFLRHAGCPLEGRLRGVPLEQPAQPERLLAKEGVPSCPRVMLLCLPGKKLGLPALQQTVAVL